MAFDLEIKAKLIADGLVTATNYFVGPKATIPAGAGPFTQFEETGGSGNVPTQVSALGYERPSAQIVVTADTRSVARSKAVELRNSLASVRNATLSGTFYLWITADQQVLDFPLDAAGRLRFGFNISAYKRPS